MVVPPSLCTWRARGLSGGFQDTGQGLEEDSKGLGPQSLGAGDTVHGEGTTLAAIEASPASLCWLSTRDGAVSPRTVPLQATS